MSRPIGQSLSSDPLLSSITHLVSQFKNHELSPVEIAEASLARIDQKNQEVRAFSFVDPDRVLEDAKRSRDRYSAGAPLSILDGIPIGIKDVISVAGMPLEAGSSTRSGMIADIDARVVELVKRAGAVIVGINTCDEFALSTVGPARNPYDSNYIAGGSSGGSAVAVALGMCAAALGTDTGGSIRIPSSCCGVTGLKPTRGRISTHGLIPMAETLDHVGIICRTPQDVGHTLSVVQDGEGLDIAARTLSLKGLRIGFDRTLLRSTHGQVRGLFDAWLSRIAKTGAMVIPVELPTLDHIRETHLTVVASELAAYHRVETTDLHRCGVAVQQVVEAGLKIPNADYQRAVKERHILTAVVDAALSNVDVLATPTIPIETPPVGVTEIEVNGESDDLTLSLVSLTSLFNHTGHPAISIPVSTQASGLPFGVQLVSRRGTDLGLLDIAAAVMRQGASGQGRLIT